MSIKQMSQVWEKANVQQGPLLVLLALADWANDKGICWPSIPAIAKKSRMSERQVRRILADLEEKRIITREEHRGRKGRDEYATNRYKLNLSVCPVYVELKPVTDDDLNLTNDACKPDICDSAIRKEPSVNTTVIEPSVLANEIPENSDALVRQIAEAHPRHEKPIETERAIVEQIERLGRNMSFENAAYHLLKRTLLFAKLTANWPRDEFRKSFPASPRWFRSGCFDENESNWEWHGNGNGTSKDEQRNARNREAIIQGIRRARAGRDAVPDGPAAPNGDHRRTDRIVDIDADRARQAVRPADS